MYMLYFFRIFWCLNLYIYKGINYLLVIDFINKKLNIRNVNKRSDTI